MKSLRNLVTNPWFVFAIVLYTGSLFVLSQRAEFSISEALIELVIFGLAWRYSGRDFGVQMDGLRELGRTHLPIVLVGSCAVLAFNYFLGGAAAPLREGKLSTLQLLAGIPLCFIWLTIEAGLVEEFFFRAFPQTRR